MKIAIIQPRTPYHVAGSEKVSIRHAEFLSKLGHQIDYYTSILKNKDETFLFKEFIDKKLQNVSVLRFDISESVTNIRNNKPDKEHTYWVTISLAFNEKIYNELKNNRPDIILSYYLPDNLFKPPKIPNVVYLSGYPSQKILWYKSFIKFCNATISISSVVSEKWREEISQIKLNYLLGTGVDYPLNYTKKITTKTKFNIVYAGRFIERKGVITMIETFNKLLLEEKDIHLWMLGSGELFENIRDDIEKHQLTDYITLTGTVENPYDYFKMADICVFPSHTGDGLMGVVLESMAAGKPVIATTGNGNEDVIKNGINGILISPNNVDELVYEIKHLLKNNSLRIKLGKNAEKFIAKNIVWDKNCVKLASLLKQIILKFSQKSSGKNFN